jgi:hypothetical protein
MRRPSAAGVALLAGLALAACESSITGGSLGEGTASMTVLFAPPSRPSAAPAAQLVAVSFTDTVYQGGFDTTLVASPGDTLRFEEIPPGDYQLAMEASTAVTAPAGTYVVWTSSQRVILLPGSVGEPVVTPDPFEVSGFSTSSTLPLTVGDPLNLSWTAVPRAADYRVSWRVGPSGPVSDTVTTGTSIAVVLGDAGTYTVTIAPRTEGGADGWPVDLATTVEVTN